MISLFFFFLNILNCMSCLAHYLFNVEDLKPSKETTEALCEMRFSEGWFLYALIEIKTRYLIEGNAYENFPAYHSLNLKKIFQVL